jgi:hypothetical protein
MVGREYVLKHTEFDIYVFMTIIGLCIMNVMIWALCYASVIICLNEIVVQFMEFHFDLFLCLAPFW